MASSKQPSLYEELYKYANKPNILIVIDSDVLNEPSGKGKRFLYNEEKNELIIDGNNLSESDEADIIKLLVESQDEGVDILDPSQADIITNYVGYSETYNPYLDTITLFKPIIPSKDFWALKMAYFMRIMNENGEDIKEYRRQIRERFGLRGLYISNLCNSSYFEGVFRNALMRLDNSKFKEYYELKVGFELAALFVHNGMTKKSIQAALQEKIDLCVKNGIFKFRVHAMGGENVDLVKNVLIYVNPEFGMDLKVKTISEAHNHPVYIDVEIEIV